MVRRCFVPGEVAVAHHEAAGVVWQGCGVGRAWHATSERGVLGL